MKYEFMKLHGQALGIKKMAKLLGVSASGYYRYLAAPVSARKQDEQRLLQRIWIIHQSSRQTYGSPRIHAELRAQGETCSRQRVARLMQQVGIKAKMCKGFKKTTHVNPQAQAAPNRLQQDFTAPLPNQRWVADITFVATLEGWLYVAAVLDLFSRRIIGLAMSERMTADLVSMALQQAVMHRKPAAGLIHHSDKGCQYTSLNFQQQLKAHGFIVSMSGTGNCFDNAAMESFFHTLKTEHTYFERYVTREQAKASIFEYIEIFYNRQRRHSTLGYLSPMAYEQHWQQQQGVSFPGVH